MFNSIRNRTSNMAKIFSDRSDVSINHSGRNSYTDLDSITLASEDVLIEMGMSPESARDNVLYASAHEGSHMQYSSKEEMKAMAHKIRDNNLDKQMSMNLFQAVEDYRIDSLAAKVRPGYWDYRKRSIQGFIDLFGKRAPEDMSDAIAKGVLVKTYGLEVADLEGWEDVDSDVINKIAEDLMSDDALINGDKTTSDKVQELVTKYFPPEDQDEDGQGKGQGEGEGEYEYVEAPEGEEGEEYMKGDMSSEDDDDTGDSESSDSEGSGGSEGDGEGEGSSGSGSGSDSIDDIVDEMAKEAAKSIMDKLLDDDKKSKADEAKSKAESEMSKAEKRAKHKEEAKKDSIAYKDFHPWKKSPFNNDEELEALACKDIHSWNFLFLGEKIDISTLSVDDAIYYLDTSITQLEGQARKIAQELRRVLNESKTDRRDKVGYRVNSRRVWKADHTNDPNIFYRKNDRDTGGYVVDLLLDASGSQGGRQEIIRAQAYVIAKACSLAGIPIRVSQFDNPHGNLTTRLVTLKNYDDEECRGAFNFTVGADNRDGLAIDATNHILQQRTERNKILVVLSDGSPCDSTYGTIIRTEYVHKQDFRRFYKRETDETYPSEWANNAVEDTALRVRNIRNNGTALLGVYVGNSEGTKEIERIIYGNDFVHVKEKDMHLFPGMFMRYLKKEIL